MADIPDNGEVVEQVAEKTVQTSNENAAYILNSLKDVRSDLIERVDTSDKRTREIFDHHEKRDQERFAEIVEVQSSLVAGQSTIQSSVGLIEDRAGQLAAKQARWLSWTQGTVIAVVGAAAATLGLVLLGLR